jgi:hypothetical protein
MAFHRQHNPAFFAKTGGRTVLSLGSWIYIGLAVIGFGGGLFLSSVSFNNSETSSLAATRPPEMIYLPPAEPEERATQATDAAPRAESLLASIDAPTTAEQSRRREDTPADAALAGFEKWSVASLSDPDRPDAAANFTAAMRHTAAGYSLANASTDGVESAFAGIELPTVPEPAAAPFLCGGFALLIGLTHLRKRRRMKRTAK